MIYLDTSAFLKLYVAEEGSETVQDLVSRQSDPVPVWDMLRAELTNALCLKVFWQELSVADADRLITLFHERTRRGQYFVPEINRGRLMSDFADLAQHTPTLGCRTMDILHVACARQLSPLAFVSFDERQRQLCNAVGVSVLP